MSSLGQTIAALTHRPVTDTGPSRLSELAWSGANPGALRGWFYIPSGLKPGAPLVVVLHGCTQTSAVYDRGSGWSTLADRQGFALLFPEQDRSNNPNLCFNWFSPADAARDAGEAQSIRAMIAAMVAEHGLDPASIHITGLSAGGAMAATMLASYPEVFASGAVIAGLPHGAAVGIPQAFGAMRGQGLPSAAALDTLRAKAAGHDGDWPRLAIWHGSADRTVAPTNADALFAQWRGAHDVAEEPDRAEKRDGAQYRGWHNAEGVPVIERWDVPGMAHGTPISPARDGLGAPLPFMLDAGVSSTARIAAFFGLLETAGAAAPVPQAETAPVQPRPAKAAAAKSAPRAKPIAPVAPVPVAAQVANAKPAAAEPATNVVPSPSAPPSASPSPAEAGGVGAYVNGVLDQHLPGQHGLFASIKTLVAQALKKAGLR